jgi:hypothetical protein
MDESDREPIRLPVSGVIAEAEVARDGREEERRVVRTMVRLNVAGLVRWLLGHAGITAVVAGLILVTCALNVRYHHQLIGGADQGSYVSMSNVLASGRGFTFSDPLINAGAAGVPSARYVPFAFFVVDGETGPLVGTRWNKGYPLLGAMGVKLFGPFGYQAVSPLAGAVGVALASYLAAQFGGRYVALLVGVMSTSWLQLFYSRYPMTEATQQAIFLLVVVLLFAGYRHPRRRLCVAAGLAAGFGIVVHYASFILIPAYLLIILLWNTKWRTRIRNTACFIFPMLLPLLMASYIDRDYSYFIPLTGYFITIFLRYIGIRADLPVLGGAFVQSASPLDLPKVIRFSIHNLRMVIEFSGPLIAYGSAAALPYGIRAYRKYVIPLIGAAALSFLFHSYFLTYLHESVEKMNAEPDIARRWVPVVMPVMYLLFAVGVVGLARRIGTLAVSWRRGVIEILDRADIVKEPGVRTWGGLWVVAAAIACVQWMTYLPFQRVRIGGELLGMVGDVKVISREYPDAVVALGKTATLFDSGMHYLFGVRTTLPGLSADVLAEVIRKEVAARGVALVLREDHDPRDEVGTAVEKTGLIAHPIAQWKVQWLNIQAAGGVPQTPYVAPMQFSLVEVSDPRSDAGKPRPLNQNVVRLRIEDLRVAPQMAAGTNQEFTVRVENAGAETLPGGRGPRSVRVSYTWWRAGEAADAPPHRCFLPVGGLKPGDAAVLRCPLAPPKSPGQYTLRIATLQEDVAWFDPVGEFNGREATVDIMDRRGR